MVFYPNVINTCHDCATPCRGVWAPNVDVAIAGGGKCAACAGIRAGQLVYIGEPAGAPSEPPAEAQRPVEEPKAEEPKAEEMPVKEPKAEPAVIDLSDGINEAEATVAGQALAQRKAEAKAPATKAAEPKPKAKKR